MPVMGGTFYIVPQRIDSIHNKISLRAIYCTICRERKKARYQELLDNEQKYEELSVMQEIRKAATGMNSFFPFNSGINVAYLSGRTGVKVRRRNIFR